MKILIKRIIILLIIISVFIVLLSCSKKSAPIDVVSNTELILCDFENLTQIQQINYFNSFGRVSLNKNKDYISSKNGSLKVEVSGEASKWPLQPYMIIYPDRFENNRFSFENTSAFLIDIYNDENEAKNIIFNFTYSDEKDIKSTFTKRVFELKPKVWNNLYIQFDADLLSEMLSLKKINEFYLVFDGIKDENQKPATLYIDNFRAKLNENEKGTKQFKKKTSEKEILFFEDYLDLSLVKADAWAYNNIFSLPNIALNRNIAFTSQGNGSLMVLSKISVNANSSAIHALEICENYFKTIDLTKYDTTKAKITFDLFNNSSTNVSLTIEVYDKSEIRYGKKVIRGINLKSKMWNMIEIPFKELVKNTSATKNSDTILPKDILKIKLSWNEPHYGGDYVFYIDNIRVES